MQTTFALAALAAVAFAAPQVTTDIPKPGAAPAGFSENYSGSFEITVVKSASKRELLPRASTCGQAGYLSLTLANGQLIDALGRTGYIAANYQFQFDAPPQTGAIYTGGFSVGSNGSLALGSSAVFYECLSGSFYNLYDRSWAAQCLPILIDIIPCSTATAGVGQQSDGQPTATSAGVVTQISDGQVQATSAVVVSEYTDGQPQVLTVLASAPVTQISDGQIQATATGTAVPITQISDGQVQATATTTAGGVVGTTASAKVSPSASSNATVSAATLSTSAKTSATSTAAPASAAAANVAVYSTWAATFVGLAAILLL